MPMPIKLSIQKAPERMVVAMARAFEDVDPRVATKPVSTREVSGSARAEPRTGRVRSRTVRPGFC